MHYIYSSSGAKYKFSPSMKEAFENNFNRLERRHLTKDEPVKVSLNREGNTFILKCQVVTNTNKRVRAEVRGEDFYTLADDIYAVIRKQITKKNEKIHQKREVKKVDNDSEVVETTFVKNKKFILDSISPEDAVNEMEARGFDWYAFRDNENSDAISVAYRRFDNTFGLVVLS